MGSGASGGQMAAKGRKVNIFAALSRGKMVPLRFRARRRGFCYAPRTREKPMAKALRWLDSAAAWGLILIGCLHNFLAAPASFDRLSADLFWFLSAGLALWYAGA